MDRVGARVRHSESPKRQYAFFCLADPHRFRSTHIDQELTRVHTHLHKPFQALTERRPPYIKQSHVHISMVRPTAAAAAAAVLLLLAPASAFVPRAAGPASSRTYTDLRV